MWYICMAGVQCGYTGEGVAIENWCGNAFLSVFSVVFLVGVTNFPFSRGRKGRDKDTRSFFK